MSQITDINPISDLDAGRLVGPGTLADLADRITASPRTGGRSRPARPSKLRRRARVVIAGGLVVAVLVAIAVSIPGTKVGSVSVGPGNAQAALSFVKRGGYIIVRVRNPLTDPARYRAEFAAHHLNITLQMVPASPSIVGTVIYFGGKGALGQIIPITAVGRCHEGGGGNVCPVGLRIPIDFTGTADIAFGRVARPGERYESSGQVTAPGEAMHGLQYKEQTVATVLAMLRARHVTVPEYREQKAHVSKVLHPGQVPHDWYVYNAIPWAPNQVLLFVGPQASAREQRGPTVSS